MAMTKAKLNVEQSEHRLLIHKYFFTGHFCFLGLKAIGKCSSFVK